MQKQIRSALISVYHKDNLAEIVLLLHKLDIKMYATGGSYDFIKSKGHPVVAVEELTGYPSILGGRVKTLHPAVFAGILNKREDNSHASEMKQYGLPSIDLVIVDLYPFKETVAAGGTEKDIIEKIDIGGISLIRAAAKNFNDVLIIPSRADYPLLMEILMTQQGISTVEQRKSQAGRAFHISSGYDTEINSWFASPLIENQGQKQIPETVLRYGENPHQSGKFIGNLDQVFTQLHGKELSYNNLLDIDAALNLIREFDKTAVAVIKHNNACGCAVDDRLLNAWEKALAGDPVSAFGGVIVTNAKLDVTTAEKINALFFEVLIAPSFEDEALQILKSKKNRILLQSATFPAPVKLLRSALNGILEQSPDNSTQKISDMRTVTKKAPSTDELDDLVFANILVKHTKSNAIVLAGKQQMFGSGTGQTSRIDALKQAIEKARHFGFSLEGAVMASDAFFPFPDCVQISQKAGITAIIQPGGSLRDQESVDEADKLGISMVLTGVRHFKH